MIEQEIIGTRAGYFVPSDSNKGYFVLVSGADCSCKAGYMGLPRCKHRAAVAALVKAQNEAAKRPVAPTHINAMVGEPPYRPDAA